MKNMIVGVLLIAISFVVYKLLSNLIITLTANDDIDAPLDYFKEVNS